MINKNAFGIIYAAEDNRNLRDLVLLRSVAALPLGGRYRAIDFVLSNMTNSGIRSIGIITQKNYKSLMDHLGSGKEWGLSRKNGGLFILPPFDTDSGTGIYEGLCDALYSKLPYIRSANREYCLLCGSYTVYSTLYDHMFECMHQNNADIVMLYSNEDCREDIGHYNDVRIYTNKEGRVTDMEYDTLFCSSNKLGMDAYLLRTDLLESLVQGARARGKHNFIVDAVLPNLKNMNVFAVPHKGYVGRLVSLPSYFEINMDMLRPPVRKDLFYRDSQVYTKIKDEPPVQYLQGARVHNTIAGDGCVIDGKAQNSVIFRKVSIGKNACINDSIIMQGTEIGEGCVLSNVIVDKYAIIRPGIHLMGAPGFPVVIRKGAVI